MLEAAADRIEAGEATFDEVVEERGLTLIDVDLGDGARIFRPGAADVDDVDAGWHGRAPGADGQIVASAGDEPQVPSGPTINAE